MLVRRWRMVDWASTANFHNRFLNAFFSFFVVEFHLNLRLFDCHIANQLF